VLRYGADCWLVNTGWVGGQYGVGKRISIRYTRAMLNAALGGKLKDVEFQTDPVFGFQVPKTCPGVPDQVLDPASSWPNRELYFQRYRQLAARFIDNFKKFDTAEAREVEKAGPKL
jgi:phosphoenolpyruvate carboxykinase (ATP)